MKKLIILLLITVTGYSQKTFINETPAQIEKFWQSKTSSENIQVHKDNKGNITAIEVMVGNIGNPHFIAQFDEKGKCAVSTTLIKDVKLPSITSNMKQNGYVYDKKEKMWYNDKIKIAIQIDDIHGENCQMVAQAY